jgi:hypothetical protein
MERGVFAAIMGAEGYNFRLKKFLPKPLHKDP